MNTARKGRAGEDFAVDFFTRKGYGVIARNFRRGRGEIDLIVGRNDEVVFVEVKHWTSYGTEAIEYGVNGEKTKRILNVAKIFAAENPACDGCRMRFDVLFVPGSERDAVHFEDAFREEK